MLYKPADVIQSTQHEVSAKRLPLADASRMVAASRGQTLTAAWSAVAGNVLILIASIPKVTGIGLHRTNASRLNLAARCRGVTALRHLNLSDWSPFRVGRRR